MKRKQCRAVAFSFIVEPEEGSRKKITEKLLDKIEASFVADLDEECKGLRIIYGVRIDYAMTLARTPEAASLARFAAWWHEIDNVHAMEVAPLALGWLVGQGVDNEMASDVAWEWADMLQDAKCVYCERELQEKAKEG